MQALRPLFHAVCWAVAVWTAPCAAMEYNKFIVFEGVAAGAAIDGGALVNTWAGSAHKDQTVVFHPDVRQFVFSHALPNTGTRNINNAEFKLIIQPNTGAVVSFDTKPKSLWDPARITVTDAPAHSASNAATSKISVVSDPSIKTRIRNDKGKVEDKEFVNAVAATLVGSAVAGKPDDGDKYHSADSWAGVAVKAAKTFVKTIDTPDPFKMAAYNGVGFAGASEISNDKPRLYVDPLFMTVNDLTTGDSTTMDIMSETVSAVAADVLMDDTGIRLAINRNNPFSTVSFEFSSESPWVLNPYHYGATLDNSGLTLIGDALPLEGWTITMTADRIEAFYDFGGDGPLFDAAIVAPPESLFTLGHEYSYDVGGGGGAHELAVADVPEPSTTALLLIGGVAGLVAAGLRRRGVATARCG